MILVVLALSAILLSVPAVCADPPAVEPVLVASVSVCENGCNQAEDACDLACLNDGCGSPGMGELCDPGCYAGCASAYLGCLLSCPFGPPLM